MKETGQGGYTELIMKQLTPAVGLVLKKVGTRFEGGGWPDIYVPSPIWHGWIELKCGDRDYADQRRKMGLLLERRVPCVGLRWRDGVETIEDRDCNVLARRKVLTELGVRNPGFELLLQLQYMFSAGEVGHALLGQRP